MFGYDTLENYFETNFSLMQHHQYRLAELEDMLPWERNIYTMLVSQFVRKENERITKENQEYQSKMAAAKSRSKMRH